MGPINRDAINRGPIHRGTISRGAINRGSEAGTNVGLELARLVSRKAMRFSIHESISSEASASEHAEQSDMPSREDESGLYIY